MTYDPKEYQRNKEKHMERQKRFRTKPENRERYLAKARKNSKIWYQNNKERRYEYNKAHWKRQIEKMEKIAGRKRPDNCEICNEGDTIVFDHCHTTGKFRGWICKRCNVTLGKVQDDPALLEKMALYLRERV